jgi:hypothetical protein
MIQMLDNMLHQGYKENALFSRVYSVHKIMIYLTWYTVEVLDPIQFLLCAYFSPKMLLT